MTEARLHDDPAPPTRQDGRTWGRDRAITLPQQVNQPIFAGLSTEALIRLGAMCRLRTFETGEHLLVEGTAHPFLYILQQGTAEVRKTVQPGATLIPTLTSPAPLALTTVGPGDILGELKLFSDDPATEPSSASVVATSPVSVISLDLDALHADEHSADLRASLHRNVGQILSDRLRLTTAREAQTLSQALAESNRRVEAARFMLVMFAVVALVTTAMFHYIRLVEAERPRIDIAVFVFLLILAGPAAICIRRSAFPLESFGLTLHRARPVALEAILLSLPIMALAVPLKLALLAWDDAVPASPLFNPASLFVDRPFSTGAWLVFVLAYIIHAPAQEFVARAAFQGMLQNIRPLPPGRTDWTAIVVSNLTFAAAHAWLGTRYVAVTFVTGLFWGWLFARQRSLVGVTVSHILIGLWSIHILGLHLYLRDIGGE